MSQIVDGQGQSALSDIQQLVYEGYLKHSGKAFADRWAKSQLAVTTSPQPELSDKLEANAKVISKAVAARLELLRADVLPKQEDPARGVARLPRVVRADLLPARRQRWGAKASRYRFAHPVRRHGFG